MATETAAPSPQDLAALESAFAADPAGNAYRPLAEAYLSLERFMEAMVVCKKGVKANPEDPSARVLLARVYAAQGKDRKAKTELEGALEIDDAAAEANRMLGLILLEEGEMDVGTERLKKAADAAPTDSGILAALEKWGIDYRPVQPEPEAPEPEIPPPPADMVPQVREVVAESAPAPPTNGGMGAVQAPAPPAPVAAPPVAAPAAAPT
ncbi:MAG: hypothetical protein P1V51_25110, partial [Deltaproteobacteria bacterium]|nr:hypothetical protein [Deltaproteobacteria bacterium]